MGIGHWFRKPKPVIVEVAPADLVEEVKRLSTELTELRKAVNRAERYYYRHRNLPVNGENQSSVPGLEDIEWLNK